MDGMNGNQIETVTEEIMVGETVVVETMENELSQSNSTAVEPDSHIKAHQNVKAQVADKKKMITHKNPKKFNPPVPASAIHVKTSTPSTKLNRRQTNTVVAVPAGSSNASPRSDAPSSTSRRQLTTAAVPAGSLAPWSDAPSSTSHRRQCNAAFGHSPSAETSFKRIASDTSATLPQKKKHKNNSTNNNNNDNSTNNKNNNNNNSNNDNSTNNNNNNNDNSTNNNNNNNNKNASKPGTTTSPYVLKIERAANNVIELSPEEEEEALPGSASAASPVLNQAEEESSSPSEDTLREFVRENNINERCLDVLPDLVRMEYWLSRHPGFLNQIYLPPQIFQSSTWEINAAARLEAAYDNPQDEFDNSVDYDELVMFEVNSREDMMAFCDKVRELELVCCARFEDPDYVGPDYEDPQYGYDYGS